MKLPGLFVCCVLATLLGASTSLSGSAVAIGTLSLDQFIPGSGTIPGVNAINIWNLTGDQGLGGFSLPPDFPVSTFLSFNSAQLGLQGSTGTAVLSLGSIPPGPLFDSGGDPVLQFPDTDLFQSISFTAVLSQTSLLLADGTHVTVFPDISLVLSHSDGSNLVPGTDQGVIVANTTPEPQTLLTLSAGAFLVARRLFSVR